MKFKKRYTKLTVTMAVMHGIVIGIAAVALVGFLLLLTDGKGQERADGAVKEVPTSGPPAVPSETNTDSSTAAPALPEEKLTMYAKQHGVFSSAQGAAVFVAEDPSLSKAAVIGADGQFFVWSAVGLTEQEIEVSEYEGTFRKPFTAETSACAAIGAGQVTKALRETDLAQIKILAESQNGDAEDENAGSFQKNLLAVSTFTNDLRIIRLQLLSHYSQDGGCIKISF